MHIHELVEKCRDAATTDDPVIGVMEVLGAFLHQTNLEQQLGRADRSTYEALYRGRDLLVLHGVVPPTPRPVDPHNHRMWAVIGVYHGREDNQLFARTTRPPCNRPSGSRSEPVRSGLSTPRRSTRSRPPMAVISARFTSTAATCSEPPGACGVTVSSNPTTSRRSPRSSSACGHTRTHSDER
jgi:hypothetical protein